MYVRQESIPRQIRKEMAESAINTLKFLLENGSVVDQSRLVEEIVNLFLDHDFDVEGIIKDYDKAQLKKITDSITEMDEVSDFDERTREFERNQL